MSRDILQAPLKPFSHGNEGVTVSLAALTVIAIQMARKTEQTEYVKGVASIFGKANLTAKTCGQVQTKTRSCASKVATNLWANTILGCQFEFLVDAV